MGRLNEQNELDVKRHMHGYGDGMNHGHPRHPLMPFVWLMLGFTYWSRRFVQRSSRQRTAPIVDDMPMVNYVPLEEEEQHHQHADVERQHHQTMQSSRPIVRSSSSSAAAAAAAAGSDRQVISVAQVSFGLMLHSAVDGIPLGFAACSGNQQVEMLLLLAVLLHKGPASFGLTSFLLGSGANRKSVLWNLLLFCISAPLGALVVVVMLSVYPTSHPENVNQLIGLGLLFSAGTMIYTISTHILPEILGNDSSTKDVSIIMLETCGFVVIKNCFSFTSSCVHLMCSHMQTPHMFTHANLIDEFD